MFKSNSTKVLLLSVILLGGAHAAAAQGSAPSVKIGVLTDMAGPFSDIVGAGSVEAARLAAEDLAGTLGSRKVEVVSGDHGNKPDIGAGIARRWLDVDGVDAIADVPVSSVALAVQSIARDRNKVVLFSGPGTDRLSGEDCAPFSVQWTYDNNTLARGTVKSIVASGGDTWFFLTSDYAFGHSLEQVSRDLITANGGKVLGAVRHPVAAADMSSFLLQAQASKAKVIGLANVGPDLSKSVKGASEFGLIAGGQRLASLLMFDNDVIALGLPVAQGLTLTTAFYWDLNESTRAFGKRFFERRGVMPNMIHAGVYSSVAHYLRAVGATDSTDAAKTIAWMRANPVNDFFARDGRLREDGLLSHDMFLMQVKVPRDSKSPHDILQLVRRIPAAEAYPSVAESKCPLVRK